MTKHDETFYLEGIKEHIAYDEAVANSIVEHIETASGDLRTWALGRYVT